MNCLAVWGPRIPPGGNDYYTIRERQRNYRIKTERKVEMPLKDTKSDKTKEQISH